MTLLKLCLSIVRKNKAFSLGLFLMSLFSIAISFLGANFTASSKTTLDQFISDCGTPNVTYTIQTVSESDLEDIKNIDGVKILLPRLVMDINILTNSDKEYSTRLLSYDKDGEYKLQIHNIKQIDSALPKVSFSYSFANYNNLNPGDTFTLVTKFGNIDGIIESTVANVETISCNKDEMSFYENYQFGYIYIEKNELSKIIGTLSLCNQFFIYLQDNLSIEREKEIVNQIKLMLGEDYISSNYIKESEALKIIADDINTINVLCIFIPGIIYAISLIFSSIFIKIIVSNQRKTIALLRALGYKIKKVVLIFILYTILINLVATILGVPIGFVLLKLGVGVIANADGILNIVFSINFLASIGLILIAFVIGALASLISSKLISKIDPVKAASENINYIDPPKLVKKIKIDGFTKISLTSIFRHYKRQILGTLCIAGCIISMCVGFCSIFSIRAPIDAVYNERFQYDLMVRDIDEQTYDLITFDVEDIKSCENTSMFLAKCDGKDIRISSIHKNSEFIKLKNSKGEATYPTNGVVIDEMFAKINNYKVGDTIKINNVDLTIEGIARELLETFFYISEETALNRFDMKTNSALIKLKNKANIDKVKKEISNINKSSYFVELALQYNQIKNNLRPMQIVMFIFSILSFLIGSLFVINITIIDFNEKKSQYATLRSIGVSINKISKVSFLENLVRVLFGILIAAPISYGLSLLLLDLLSNASKQYVLMNFLLCLSISCLITLLYLLISLFVSRRKIKKINLIENLGNE